MNKVRTLTATILFAAVSSVSATNWPLNCAAAGCVVTAATVGYKTLRGYQVLAPLHEKVQSEHVLLGESSAQSSSFCRWKRDIWPTARAMQHDRENVKRAFSAAFVHKELLVYNSANTVLMQPTWLDIKEAVIREKEDIRKDLLFLENNFLTTTPLLSFMSSRGFVYDYKTICKTVNADPYATMAWTEAQEQQIEVLVKKLYNNKGPVTFGLPNIIALIGFNYSLAASIYWRLFKFFKRLEVLEGIVSELAVGYDTVYVRPQENNVSVTLR
jgi:hypothetical protein